MGRGALFAIVGALAFLPASAAAAPGPLADGESGTSAAQDPTSAGEASQEPLSERRAPQWWERGEDAGPTYNCTILGGGYYENLGRAWAGWYGDLGSTPTTNQIYYVRAGWGVSGFPCGSGGAQVHLEMVLPAYTKLAISQQNPVECYYDGLSSDYHRFTDDCPQNPGTGYNGGPSFDPPGQSTWPTASGTFYEIYVPVKTTQHLNGLEPAGNQPCMTCLYVGAWMIDGTYSPWVYPRVPVYVAGSGGPAPDPSVSYPAPATSDVFYDSGQQVIAARFYANLLTEGTAGTAQFEMGPEKGDYRFKGEAIEVPNPGNYLAYEDWGMNPGHVYHWRLCYKPNGGDKVCGPDQTVNAPPETGIAEAKINKSRRKATFFFGAPQVQNMTFTFECKLDSAKFKPCESGETGKTYSRLSKGRHTFAVRAVDQDGHPDATPAKHSFKL